MNVADKVTKWGHGPDFAPSSEWYKGPDFLYLPENEWDHEELEIVESPEELKTVNVHQEVSIDPIVVFTAFSNLNPLLKRLAYLHHFRRCFRLKQRSSTETGEVTLTQEEYEAAEKSLWKMVQAKEFPKELATLRRNATLPPEEQVRLERRLIMPLTFGIPLCFQNMATSQSCLCCGITKNMLMPTWKPL